MTDPGHGTGGVPASGLPDAALSDGAPPAAPPESGAPPAPAAAATPVAAGLGNVATSWEEADDRRSTVGAVRDNLEAVAFALILALLLRQFCLEVFKIPTASMEPTLYGEGPEGRHGDRIVVDKLGYATSGPRRWDVDVFHHVLDWSRDFIKRVAVLPGECAQIVRGDVWVADAPRDGSAPKFHPARKPARVRDQLYLALYPPTDAAEVARLGDFWRPEPNATGSVRLVSPREFRFEGGASPPPAGAEPESTLVYRRGSPVLDGQTAAQPRSTSGNVVPDVRVRATVRAEASAEVEIAWKPGDGREHVLRVATPDRGPSTLRTKGTTGALPRGLEAGRDVDVALESVDGDAHAWIDGEEVRTIADEISIEDAIRMVTEGPAEPQSLSIHAKGGPVVVRDVRLDRDLHYTGVYESEDVTLERGQWWRTGPDEYVMLGDNTQHSSDSRRWRATGVRLRDGREIWWDPQAPPQSEPRGTEWWKTVTDVEGVVRRWRDEDVDPEAGTLRKPMPYVKRDRIVGRAFFGFVFWPFDSTFLHRMRFIR